MIIYEFKISKKNIKLQQIVTDIAVKWKNSRSVKITWNYIKQFIFS
jgi:hypothetical protein